MSRDPLESKIAAPYARALYDYSVEENIIHQITADFQNLQGKVVVECDLETGSDRVSVFTSKDQTSQETIFISEELGKFFKLLVRRSRLPLASEISKQYLDIVYKTAGVRVVEVSTAFPFTTVQKLNLIKKLKILMSAREIRLIVTVDSSLIGGFLMKIDSTILDFTIKNQLENLARKLDWSRGIDKLEQSI